MRLDRSAVSVETKDFRWSIESAQHNDDASVLFQMRDCFNAAAAKLYVSNLARAQYPKTIESLRRTVDPAIIGERCRRYEEHALAFNPTLNAFVDFPVLFSHG